MRVKGIVLKHHADVALFGSDVGHGGIVKINFPFGRLFQAGNHRKGGAFSAAGGTEQTDHFPVGNHAVHIADCNGVFKLFGDMLHADFHERLSSNKS